MFNKLLKKIEWYLRKTNLKISFLDIYLHDGDECIGFSFIEIVNDYRPYSLLSIEFILPNGTNRQKLRISNWDFLFLSNLISEWLINIKEKKQWNNLNKWQSFLYKILSVLYK